jgi:ABC-type glycerol-3-phosphate transport system substrate-binding protein
MRWHSALYQVHGRFSQLVLSCCLILALLSLFAGCSAPATLPPATPSAQPLRPAASPPAATPDPTRLGPQAVPLTGTVSSGALVLTWWTPEIISPKAGQADGGLMAEYLRDFEASQDHKVRIEPVLKAKYGKGGLLDYLRTAQPVAPTLMPDIVSIDTAELEQAASLGLLQPLDRLLDVRLIAGLYPFARDVGVFDGRQLAVQFVADLDHTVYDRAQIIVPPSNWNTLLANKTRYAFPAGNPQPVSGASLSDDVQPLLISQYLSAGGTTKAGTRQLVLQEEPLLRVLTFYSEGQTAGVLNPRALEMASADDAVGAYARGDADMTQVSARQYLASQDSLPNAGYAPTPGWDKPAQPVARGWALAITTTDPARQKAAADFLTWLLAPEHAGAWAHASGWLPVAPEGWTAWDASAYHDFLNQQLSIAVAHPGGADYAQMAGELRKAITAVLKDRTPPAQAVQTALSATGQTR